jgi:small-conductance mechanosensitive channel
LSVLSAVLITLFGIRAVIQLLTYLMTNVWLARQQDEKLERSIKGFMPILKTVIWGLGIVFLLDNMGFKISAVLAGLGIGGIAVALAAQAILGDLFSYFCILFDRPFELGDFIIQGEYMGTVEKIGIKTTRIRSLGGEQLVFSNTDLTNSRVRNYKRMQLRRVVFNLGVTYQTTLEQIKAAPEIIKDIILKTPETKFDRAHFASYGDFSLNIEVVYYVMSSDYNKYMDIQQAINFHIKEAFEKRGLEFAYPSQTIFMAKTEKEKIA